MLAFYPDTDTSSVVGFTVAKPGFADSLGVFREATLDHSQALSLGQNDFADACPLLQSVAEQYSALGCHDAALLCYQDLATLSREAGDTLAAKGAVQRGLLNALAGSCGRATSEDEVSLDDAPPGDITLDGLTIERWQISELMATAKWVERTIVRSAADQLFLTLSTLIALKERHPVLIAMLERGSSSPRYRKLCKLGLEQAQFQPELPRRSEILIHAEQDSETDRELLLELLRGTDRDELFQQLVALLNMLSWRGQRGLLRALFAIWPVRPVEVDDELRLYTEAGVLVATVLNSGPAVKAIAASVASTSFAEVKDRVMRVGA